MATVSAPKMTAERKKWQAQDDAHTLASAERIKADKGRFGAAQKQAKVMASDMQKEAQAISAVAAGNVPKSAIKMVVRRNV